MTTRDNLTITRAGRERLDDVAPLWMALHRHHVTIDPRRLTPRPDSDSWAARRAEYDKWIDENDGFFLLAEIDGRPVGYAMVSIGRQPPQMWDTDPPAVLQTLSVLPAYRDKGIGSALMKAVHAELRRLGVEQMVIGVLAANERAMKLYQRYGYRPALHMLWGRVPPD